MYDLCLCNTYTVCNTYWLCMKVCRLWKGHGYSYRKTMKRKITDQISHMVFINREQNFRHSDYEEEMRMYRHVRDGDLRSVEEARLTFCAQKQGHLSDDPLTNMKYLFVASMTLVMRFAVSGGMNSETAYTTSDYYIQQMDKYKTVEDISRLHEEAIEYFTRYMRAVKKEKVYSKTVMRCMDYIHRHLNSSIRVTDIAGQIKRNPDYLSSLFKKETGISITDYIMESKLRAAESMLLDTECSCAAVSAAFAFSSQSYFTKLFRQYTGQTPKKYRERYVHSRL